MSASPGSPADISQVVPKFFQGLRIRIAASLALVVGGFVFVLLYLAFWATKFTWYQNVAVVLSTALVVPVALVALWVTWGLGVARRGYRSAFAGWDRDWD